MATQSRKLNLSSNLPDSVELATETPSPEDAMMKLLNDKASKQEEFRTKSRVKSPDEELANLEVELHQKAEELAAKTPQQQLSTNFGLSELEAKVPNDQTREFIRIAEFIQNEREKNIEKEDIPTSSDTKLTPQIIHIQKYAPPPIKQKGLQLNKAV